MYYSLANDAGSVVSLGRGYQFRSANYTPGNETKGKERKGKEREGKEREGKERKGKERKGKERKALAKSKVSRVIVYMGKYCVGFHLSQIYGCLIRSGIRKTSI